jgi:CheY-like chemotaxis protein
MSQSMTYCKTVWLIDDDEVCNYLTTRTLQLNKFSSEVRSFTNAQEVLTEHEASVEPKKFPDFIFLDLNMPEIDGWQFLKADRQLPEELKDSCTLYILSSSIDEDDINKSKLHEDVRDFLSKPLNKRDLEIVKVQEQ